ncbi:uncharacterized protein LOC135925245 isoform X2 [Gordionus sp. m RMFG-2023]|uniref:uncharacterized protein LOC135925245 isoform X2 n=1 Tax=Gordionus sp. m RMFG-2023 TaxID=3053472 RepID=UPI0031FD2F1B
MLESSQHHHALSLEAPMPSSNISPSLPPNQKLTLHKWGSFSYASLKSCSSNSRLSPMLKPSPISIKNNHHYPKFSLNNGNKPGLKPSRIFNRHSFISTSRFDPFNFDEELSPPSKMNAKASKTINKSNKIEKKSPLKDNLSGSFLVKKSGLNNSSILKRSIPTKNVGSGMKKVGSGIRPKLTTIRLSNGSALNVGGKTNANFKARKVVIMRKATKTLNNKSKNISKSNNKSMNKNLASPKKYFRGSQVSTTKIMNGRATPSQRSPKSINSNARFRLNSLSKLSDLAKKNARVRVKSILNGSTMAKPLIPPTTHSKSTKAPKITTTPNSSFQTKKSSIVTTPTSSHGRFTRSNIGLKSLENSPNLTSSLSLDSPIFKRKSKNKKVILEENELKGIFLGSGIPETPMDLGSSVENQSSFLGSNLVTKVNTEYSEVIRADRHVDKTRSKDEENFDSPHEIIEKHEKVSPHCNVTQSLDFDDPEKSNINLASNKLTPETLSSQRPRNTSPSKRGKDLNKFVTKNTSRYGLRSSATSSTELSADSTRTLRSRKNDENSSSTHSTSLSNVKHKRCTNPAKQTKRRSGQRKTILNESTDWECPSQDKFPNMKEDRLEDLDTGIDIDTTELDSLAINPCVTKSYTLSIENKSLSHEYDDTFEDSEIIRSSPCQDLDQNANNIGEQPITESAKELKNASLFNTGTETQSSVSSPVSDLSQNDDKLNKTGFSHNNKNNILDRPSPSKYGFSTIRQLPDAAKPRTFKSYQDYPDRSATNGMVVKPKERKIFTSSKDRTSNKSYQWQTTNPNNDEKITSLYKPDFEEEDEHECDNNNFQTKETTFKRGVEITNHEPSNNAKLVRDVKQAYQCHECGEVQDFNDDVEYLLAGLRPGINTLAMRCLSILGIANKCLSNPFRTHLRAQGLFLSVFSSLNDAFTESNLFQCTTALVFSLTLDKKMHSEIDPSTLSLLIHCCNNSRDISASPNKDKTNNALSTKNAAKITLLLDALFKDQVNNNSHTSALQGTSESGLEDNARELKAAYLSDPRAFLDVRRLSLETLINLSCYQKCNSDFRQCMREHKGIDIIIQTTMENYEQLVSFNTATVADEYLIENKLKRLSVLILVLENLIFMDKDNQNYLLNYKDEFMRTLLCIIKHCIQNLITIPLNPKVIVESEEYTFKQPLIEFHYQASPIKISQNDTIYDKTSHLNLLLGVLRLMINLTHENETGCKKIVFNSLNLPSTDYKLFADLVCLVLAIKGEKLNDKIFDLIVLVLCFLINLMEYCDENKKLCLCQNESLALQTPGLNFLKLLVKSFFEYTRLANLAESDNEIFTPIENQNDNKNIDKMGSKNFDEHESKHSSHNFSLSTFGTKIF